MGKSAFMPGGVSGDGGGAVDCVDGGVDGAGVSAATATTMATTTSTVHTTTAVAMVPTHVRLSHPALPPAAFCDCLVICPCGCTRARREELNSLRISGSPFALPYSSDPSCDEYDSPNAWRTLSRRCISSLCCMMPCPSTAPSRDRLRAQSVPSTGPSSRSTVCMPQTARRKTCVMLTPVVCFDTIRHRGRSHTPTTTEHVV